jgi:hypothetical protein
MLPSPFKNTGRPKTPTESPPITSSDISPFTIAWVLYDKGFTALGMWAHLPYFGFLFNLANAFGGLTEGSGRMIQGMGDVSLSPGRDSGNSSFAMHLNDFPLFVKYRFQFLFQLLFLDLFQHQLLL